MIDRPSNPQLRVHIRWMIRRDMPEVLDIERASFEFPWSEEDFIRCLRQRNCIGMVAEHGERVVGFMIYELHKTRLHILNFAVAADVRRRGVGRQMIDKLDRQALQPAPHADHARSPRDEPRRPALLPRQRLPRHERAARLLRRLARRRLPDAILLRVRRGGADPADEPHRPHGGVST